MSPSSLTLRLRGPSPPVLGSRPPPSRPENHAEPASAAPWTLVSRCRTVQGSTRAPRVVTSGGQFSCQPCKSRHPQGLRDERSPDGTQGPSPARSLSLITGFFAYQAAGGLGCPVGVTTEVSGSCDIWWPRESRILAPWPFTGLLPIPDGSSAQSLSPV